MKRAEFRDRTQVLISTERDMFKEFQQLCDRESKSVSLKLKEMINEELEKNAIGHVNPIAVKFREGDSTSNTLDYYLDNGFVTTNYFMKELRDQDKPRLEQLIAFGKTITQAATNLHYYKTTGKYRI